MKNGVRDFFRIHLNLSCQHFFIKTCGILSQKFRPLEYMDSVHIGYIETELFLNKITKLKENFPSIIIESKYFESMSLL